MKKIFKILIVILAVCFIMPQIALASWWNPFTWNIWGKFVKPVVTITTPAQKNNTPKNQNKTQTQTQTNNMVGKFIKSLPDKSPAKNNNSNIDWNKVANDINKVEAENFYDQLISLYKEKIDFLNKETFLFDTYKMLADNNIDFENKSIALLEPPSAYSDPAAVQIYRLELNEDTQFSSIWQSRSDQYNQLKKKLQDELAAIDSNVIISNPEYLMRQGELNTLVDESAIQKEDNAISNSVYFKGTKRKEINDAIEARAENAVAWAQGELLRIKSDLSNTTIYMPPVIPAPITPAQLQPSSIDCQTTHVNGNPQISCTDTSTMKTMVCDGTYTPTSGSDPNYHCYSR
jgi:hypothetical protein